MKLSREKLMIVAGLIILIGCNGKPGDVDTNINKNIIGGLYEINENGKEYKFYSGDQSFKLDTLTFISFSDFSKIFREESPEAGVYSLGFRLNKTGTLKFNEMTLRNINKQVCLVVGNKVIAAPTVYSAIPNGQASVTVTDKKVMDELIEQLKN